MASPYVDAVIAELWRAPLSGAPGQVYAILDAARDEAIYPAVAALTDLEWCCLYRGDPAEELAEVAPYLVALQREHAFTRWVIGEGWGNAWGIFCAAPVALNELRRHFRRFLMVYDPEGKPLYFRYYDPRVLRVYLPTCNAEELATVFGPVGRYCLEGEDPELFGVYRVADGVLGHREATLAMER